MKISLRAQRGISMLEVLVTTFIVTTGLLVVMMGYVSSTQSNRYSERMDMANTIIRAEMERVRNLPFANVVSSSGAYGDFTQYPDFRRDITVTDLISVREVKIEVFFENDTRKAEAITYIANL